MVSNDDISRDTVQNKQASISTQQTVSTGSIFHVYTVPANVVWNVTAIRAHCGTTVIKQVLISDNAGGVIEVHRHNLTIPDTFMAPNGIPLSAGWGVKIWFGGGANRVLDSAILYESETIY